MQGIKYIYIYKGAIKTLFTLEEATRLIENEILAL